MRVAHVDEKRQRRSLFSPADEDVDTEVVTMFSPL